MTFQAVTTSTTVPFYLASSDQTYLLSVTSGNMRTIRNTRKSDFNYISEAITSAAKSDCMSTNSESFNFLD